MTLTLFAMWRFTAVTPIRLVVLVTAVAGFGLGVIPTINNLVAQFAVPRRLLGVAVGAIFFFQMAGLAAAPSNLGLAQYSAAALEGGLKLVFLVGAVTMTIAFLLIFTIPEVSIGRSGGQGNRITHQTKIGDQTWILKHYDSGLPSATPTAFWRRLTYTPVSEPCSGNLTM